MPCPYCAILSSMLKPEATLTLLITNPSSPVWHIQSLWLPGCYTQIRLSIFLPCGSVFGSVTRCRWWLRHCRVWRSSGRRERLDFLPNQINYINSKLMIFSFMPGRYPKGLCFKSDQIVMTHQRQSESLALSWCLIHERTKWAACYSLSTLKSLWFIYSRKGAHSITFITHVAINTAI